MMKAPKNQFATWMWRTVHRGQSVKSTGTVMCASRCRVTPPSAHSRRREWP